MSLSCLFLLLLCVSVFTAQALILPPRDRMRMGLFEAECLEEECQEASDGARFYYEVDVDKDYQLGASVFTRIAQCNREPTKIWLPSCLNRQGEIDRLTAVLNENCDRLGGVRASCEHWPEVPASVIDISWDSDVDERVYAPEAPEVVQAAIKNTEDYVVNKVCKLNLCPYTKSMTRAAIGLEGVGVKEGPVVIRHAANAVESPSKASPAAILTAMYWQGVKELIERPEDEVATLLLVAPACFDIDFEAFYKTCDNLIEKSVTLLSGSVGRVWFHPQYELAQIGYCTGGHTVPLHVVDQYMDDYLNEHPAVQRPAPEEIRRGHDQSRRTPHAIINLLRGPQLKKAKAKEKNHKFVYAKNILTLLEAELNRVN
jgi:hypothetical protein